MIELAAFIVIGGAAGKLLALAMNYRDSINRERRKRELEAVMPPAGSSFYPHNRGRK